MLGVCRGAQVINVAHGGTLYQDLATQMPTALNHRNWTIYEDNCHAIAIVAGTGLARLYPGAALREDQHDPPPGDQGPRPRTRDRGALGPDGVVEAIRWTGAGYVFGVQWHPEFHDPADATLLDGTPILDDFLATAARHKAAAFAL